MRKQKASAGYNTLIYTLVAILIVFAMFLSWSYVNEYNVALAAVTVDHNDFDDTYVMDDLEGITINGIEFDITDWSFDESRQIGIILFTEYCYSFYANKQGNYALYVYVWNPQGLDIDVDSTLNMIQIGIDPNYSSNYQKYNLEFLSMCTETNYEGLFYKFRVYLNDNQKAYLLSSLDSSERFYHISGIELMIEGDTNATETTINLEYRFSGYAEGYGTSSQSESTLTFSIQQGEILTLEVHGTFYRPSGAIEGDLVYRDTLHSVYFSVPNSVIDDYGNMTAVHATWLNALTQLIYVTGNSVLYSYFSGWVGVELPTYYDSIAQRYYYGESGERYGFVADAVYSEAWLLGVAADGPVGGDYAYNLGNFGQGLFIGDRAISTLYYLFYASNGDADTYILSGEDIIQYLIDYTAVHGGDLVNGKYSAELFAEVDDEWTEVYITAGDTYTLTSQTITQNWWQKLFGVKGSEIAETTTYEGISAIYEVKQSDITGDVTADCDYLYIDENDYAEFVSYCQTAWANNETVYLFRYYQSTYYSAECTQFSLPEQKDYYWYNYGQVVDTNAYLAQMWIQLDFDIIDVTFTSEEGDTILPVVSSPIDLVADVEYPLYTTSDDDGVAWWAYVIIVLAEIIVLLLLSLILCKICNLPSWVMIILLVIVIVMDILFIEALALQVTEWLDPYLYWIPT